jgi:hypothetical protein
MNLPSGHKRINSAYNQPYSGQKITPRTTIGTYPIQKKSISKESFTKVTNLSTASTSKNHKGSILFQNYPLKLEGDLMGSSKRQSREHSQNRSLTPNKSQNSSRIYGSQNFKSNVIPASKIKKPDFSSKTGKNVKNIIQKNIRDPLNMSNISSSNRSRLNDTNNSFVGSDSLNRTRFGGSSLIKNGINLKQRVGTPNSRLNNSQITKSSSDLHRKLNNKSPLSKSPNNINKFSSKIQSLGNLNNNSNKLNKNGFDTSLIKQLNDFKNNKSPTPNILKNLNNSFNKKPINATKITGGPITKKIISGNLINMNMTNDVSTNSTFISKDLQSKDVNIERMNSRDISNDPSSHNLNFVLQNQVTSNFVGNLINTSNTYHNSANTFGKKDSKEEKALIGERFNLQKEKELKGVVDFREITTSPLLRVFLFYFRKNRNI